jgi:ABC-type phosphate transport system substrate-binding protein
MSTLKMKLLKCAALAGIFCGGAYAQCPTNSLAVVVNKANATESLSTAQLRRLVLGDVRGWPDHKPVTLVSRDFSSKPFECTLSMVVRQSPAEYRRYVMNAEFRGEEPMAIQTADSAATAGKMVASSQGAIAIVEASAVAAMGATVKVVRVNGKLPGEAGYPL